MFRKLLFVVCAVALFWGCAKKQLVKPSEEISTPSIESLESKDEASVRYTDWHSIPQLKTIYFDYDRTDLRADDRVSLKANAEYLKSNPNFSVIVEGHCDERGTTEYNLALGQRRAAAVRSYYGQLGVPLSRIGTISYGEEIPVDSGRNENAWAKNRRGETKVRSK